MSKVRAAELKGTTLSVKMHAKDKVTVVVLEAPLGKRVSLGVCDIAITPSEKKGVWFLSIKG